MKALFEIGEEVVVCSKYSPELNGEYIIKSIHHDGNGLAHYKGGKISDEVSYKLTGLDSFMAVRQSSLRKKHKPSDYNFNELMSEIKDLVTV